MRRGAVVTAIGLGIGIGLVPGSAAGSCAEFPPLEEHLAQAEVVFVGTVTAVTDEQRTGLVEVEEIWRGPALPAEVTIHGGFEDLGFTSADRSFEVGTRYLFAASFDDGGLQDNACTATRPWTDELSRLRPATASSPAVESDPDGQLAVPAFVVALAVLAVGAGSLLAFRSRS